AVSQLIKQETRPLPKATADIDIEPQLRLLCPVGGMITFSGAQMHSSVPNTSGKTRYSIDFRTVHLEDVEHRRAAPRSDEHCTGPAMRDCLRAVDFARGRDALVALYDDETAARGTLVFRPTQT